ncbi:MAG: hypothetical protein CMH53_03420, partial [Myxococcales bacterium]|nr:hypothetical protein [Myxococcales bacterium]
MRRHTESESARHPSLEHSIDRLDLQAHRPNRPWAPIAGLLTMMLLTSGCSTYGLHVGQRKAVRVSEFKAMSVQDSLEQTRTNPKARNLWGDSVEVNLQSQNKILRLNTKVPQQCVAADVAERRIKYYGGGNSDAFFRTWVVSAAMTALSLYASVPMAAGYGMMEPSGLPRTTLDRNPYATNEWSNSEYLLRAWSPTIITAGAGALASLISYSMTRPSVSDRGRATPAFRFHKNPCPQDWRIRANRNVSLDLKISGATARKSHFTLLSKLDLKALDSQGDEAAFQVGVAKMASQKEQMLHAYKAVFNQRIFALKSQITRLETKIRRNASYYRRAYQRKIKKLQGRITLIKRQRDGVDSKVLSRIKHEQAKVHTLQKKLKEIQSKLAPLHAKRKGKEGLDPQEYRRYRRIINLQVVTQKVLKVAKGKVHKSQQTMRAVRQQLALRRQLSSKVSSWRGAVRFKAGRRGKTKKVTERKPQNFQGLIALFNDLLAPSSKPRVSAKFHATVTSKAANQDAIELNEVDVPVDNLSDQAQQQLITRAASGLCQQTGHRELLPVQPIELSFDDKTGTLSARMALGCVLGPASKLEDLRKALGDQVKACHPTSKLLCASRCKVPNGWHEGKPHALSIKLPGLTASRQMHILDMKCSPKGCFGQADDNGVFHITATGSLATLQKPKHKRLRHPGLRRRIRRTGRRGSLFRTLRFQRFNLKGLNPIGIHRSGPDYSTFAVAKWLDKNHEQAFTRALSAELLDEPQMHQIIVGDPSSWVVGNESAKAQLR